MISVIIFFAAAIQGMTSFGFSLIALPLLALILPVKSVVAMLVCYSLVINSLLLIRIYRHVRLSLIVPLLLGAVCGLPIGLLLLSRVDNHLLTLIAGVVIVAVAIVMMAGWRLTVASSKRNMAMVGALSGIMQGSLSLSGPAVVFFLTNQSVEKKVFRATLTSYFLVLNIMTLPSFLLSGVMVTRDLTMIVNNSWVVPLGIVCGHLLSAKIHQQTFQRITLALMVMAGLAAIFL